LYTFVFIYLQQDEVIDKADGVVKETVVLRHYFTVSYARFQHACKKGSIVAEDEPSLEDCIFGLKQAAKKGTHIKVAHFLSTLMKLI
jgi:hypothetical protein